MWLQRGPVLSGWMWKDTYEDGQTVETYVTEIRGCNYFRRNPWACKAGVELKAVNPIGKHTQATPIAT